MERFQNLAMKGFTGTWIHVFLSSFAKIGKAKVTKQVRGIHHKKLVFCPFSVASGAISPKILQDHYFPIPIPLPSFVNIRPVFGEIYPKMSSRHIITLA